MALDLSVKMAYPQAGLGAATSVRPVGLLKARIENMNGSVNRMSEDIHCISLEIDRIVGCQAVDPSKSSPERPPSCDLDSMQEQLDRLDRLAQFVHGQLERLRSI